MYQKYLKCFTRARKLRGVNLCYHNENKFLKIVFDFIGEGWKEIEANHDQLSLPTINNHYQLSNWIIRTCYERLFGKQFENINEMDIFL